MAKFIKTKNMPSLPVITFATETNTHKKNFGKVSKSIILMIEGGKGMTNFLIIKPTHTYITLHTMYLLCIYYVLCTIFISSLHSRLHLLVNQSNMYYRDDDALCRIFWERHFSRYNITQK